MALKNFLKVVKVPEPPRVEQKAHAPASHDESNWLVSYADMMTLLCGFFIMMFSLANMDQKQYEVIREAMTEQFGGKYESPTAKISQDVTEFVEQNAVKGEVRVTSDAAGVTVAFHSTLFFDTLGSAVKPEGTALLEKLIELVQKRQAAESKEYRIVVEGHTDSRPIVAGVYPSNWELSGARAASVVRLFLSKGFTANRLTAIGYADTYPETPERLPDGTLSGDALAKNRRVVIRILQPKVDSIPLPPANALTPGQAVSSAH